MNMSIESILLICALLICIVWVVWYWIDDPQKSQDQEFTVIDSAAIIQTLVRSQRKSQNNEN